jgi:regulator of nucleoside diphosphate kinase
MTVRPGSRAPVEVLMNARRNLPPITVATDDYRRLVPVAKTLADQSHPLASLLLLELLRVELCEPDALPPDVVSLDRFVAYRLAEDGAPEYRALVHPDDRMWPPAEISILSPVGLSLLGLRLGDRMPLLGSGDEPNRWVEVVGVGPWMTSGLVPRAFSARAGGLLF